MLAAVRRPAREDDDLLGRSGHRDIAVDRFLQLQVSDRTRDVAPNVVWPMTQAIPLAPSVVDAQGGQIDLVEPDPL